MADQPFTIVTAYLEALTACRFRQEQAMSSGQVEMLRVLTNQETYMLDQLATAMGSARGNG